MVLGENLSRLYSMSADQTGGTIMYSFAPTPEPDKPAETVITPPIKPVPRLGETPSPASFKNHKQLPLHRRHGRKESNSDL